MQERSRTMSTTLCVLAAAAVLLAAPAPCSAQQQQQALGISEACRKAASAHAGVSYDHCVSSLLAAAASHDAHSLAVSAARMAADHASATEARMEALREVEESPHARARLHHCLDLYSGAADALRDALDNLRARVYGKATQQLAAALGASESCEDVWKGEERVPVAAHDREYGRMAVLALGLATGAMN